MPPVLHPPLFDHVPDIRLIAVDLDGTLLDDDKAIHDDFWPLLDELAGRGIVLCPASGRQYAALRRQIGRPELVYVAENGAYVVRDDVEVSSETLSPETARSAIPVLRTAVHTPSGMPTSTESTMVARISSMVAGSRCPMSLGFSCGIRAERRRPTTAAPCSVPIPDPFMSVA